MNKTKIIATVGPASDSKEKIQELINAGVDLFRFNMSHADHKSAKAAMGIIRKLDKKIGILVDLQGPRIRTGNLEGGCVVLEKGSEVTITTQKVLGNKSLFSVDYEDLHKEIKPGQRILIDNGLIEVKVMSIGGNNINCKVVNGGELGEHKGLNVPGVSIFKKALTEKDIVDLDFAIAEGADYVALSFIKSQDDVLEAKKHIEGRKSNIPVIAKIENQEGISRLDAIINVSDAVMIARGDMGVELNPEEVPVIQKDIIIKCAKAGKPVIVASQMLESMVENPRPTRAESSDVANAIIDGADAVMLSEETSKGKYPVESVTMMSKIIDKVEERGLLSNLSEDDMKKNTAFVVSYAAAEMSTNLNAKAIISFTSSGSTALMVSKWRPKSQILASVTTAEASRKVSLYWGVTPIIMEEFNNTDEMIEKVREAVVSQNILKKGDLIVITAGVPIGVPGTTNFIKVHLIN